MILESNDSFVLWPAQENYVAAMKEVIRKTGVGIFQAGTGFGKTIANLIAAFDSDQKPKVFYFSRTHQQAFQVIKEAQRLQEVRAVHLAARRRLCHIPEIYMSPWETQLCKTQQDIWKKGGFSRHSATGCHSFFARKKGKRQVSEWKAQSAGIPANATLTDLNQFAKNNRCCAYLTARDLAVVRPLVVGSYMYGLDSQIRAALSISLSGSIVILDEGHNLEEVCCTILSQEISSKDLVESTRTLERLQRQFMLQNRNDKSLKPINSLLEYTEGLSILLKGFSKNLEFKKESDGETALTKGSRLTDFFQERAFNKKMGREWFSLLNELEKPYKDDPDGLQQFTSLHKLADFILALQQPIGFGVIIHKRSKAASAEAEFLIRWECLDPGLILSEVNSEAKALIICSGTLEPLKLTSRIFGLEEAECQNFGSTIESENVLVFAIGKDPDDERLSSEYKHRKSVETYRAYARAIERASTFINGGILCFFPSYAFLNNVVERGFRSSTLETVFVEERSSRANEEELRAFRQAVQSNKLAIFCAVVGGKVAEGTDLPQELSRGVIVCGIPFLPTQDPIVRLRRDYYNEKSSQLGEAWYLRESIRRAAQALGRGWRGKTDYAVGFLLDSRYLHRRNRQYIPERFRARIEILPNWDEVERRAKDFLGNIQTLEE
ncbi:MAG: helicase C-terminal domain-containing protein [Candidatus Thorarchaeota archaeon]